jgi:hypothetical protein
MHSNIYWRAVYKDGTELSQFKEDGSENKYPDIDRGKLAFFEIHSTDSVLFRLHLEPGRRLIVRKRIIGNLFNPTDKKVVWMVGWQWNENGRNLQDIAWVFEDGHVELTGRFKECPFNGPEKLLECEKED